MSAPIRPGRIPVGDARRLAHARGCPLVVIFALADRDGASFSVTTYGMNKALCRLAASFGQQCAEAILDGTVEPPQTEPLDLPGEPAVWRGHRTPPGQER